MTEEASPQSKSFDSFQSWLAIYGNAEYALYRRTASPPHISYEEWASSEQSLGPYLYHLTLDAWEAATSSDEDSVLSASPGGPKPVPTETVTTNGNGVPHANNSATSAADANAGEPAPSSKKRRRSKKKFLSEPIVSSDDVDEPSASTREANTEEHDTSVGKRKSKKKNQSDQATLPEDIERSTPVANASTPNSATATPDGLSPSSAPSRRGLRFRTPAQQRPYFHHAKMFEDEEATNQTPKDESVAPKQRLKLTLNSRPVPPKDTRTDDTPPATASVTPQSVSPIQSEPRRRSAGKGRPWKKDDEEDDQDYHAPNQKKPKKKGRPRKSLPANFKVKDDPDRVAEKETSKISSAPPPAKSTRKAKRSHLSQEFVRDDSESEEVAPAPVPEQPASEVNDDPANVEAQGIPRPKRRPRKSYISEEYIVDDSDSDAQPDDGAIETRDEPTSHKDKKAKRKPKRAYISQEFVVESDSDNIVVKGNDSAIETTAVDGAGVTKGVPKKSGTIKFSALKKSAQKSLGPDTDTIDVART